MPRSRPDDWHDDVVVVLVWICAVAFVGMLLTGARRVHDMSECVRLARRYQVSVTYKDFCIIHTAHGDVPAEHWIPSQP